MLGQHSVCVESLADHFLDGHGEEKDRLGKISDPGAAEKWYGGHPSTRSEKELGKMADPQNT